MSDSSSEPSLRQQEEAPLLSSSSQTPTSQQQQQHQQHVLNAVLENEELLFSILDFCNEESRRNFMFLSHKHCTILTSETSFKWRVECLHREFGIYYPLMIVPGGGIHSTKSVLKESSWKDVFLANNKIKDLWQPKSFDSSSMNDTKKKKRNVGDNDVYDNNSDGDDDDKMQFNIKVSARFKPRNMNPYMNDTATNGRKKISLPLYQRLALIKMNRNLKTKKEAFQALVEQGEWSTHNNYDDDDDDSDGSGVNNESEENKIIDDKNYFTDKNFITSNASKDERGEEGAIQPSIRGGVHIIDSKDNFAVLIDPIKGLRKFDFDNVFHEDCSQDFVYQKTAMPLIWEFMNSFNVSCIVYGQTGSGKTHTMYGDNEFEMNQSGMLPTAWGIVPRSIYEVFQAIEYRNTNINLEFDVEIGISYIEIFGDSVTDLLRAGKSCGQSKVATQRYVLDGSSEKIITSMKDALELLNVGEKQKRKAATAMNERSSRAHSIFMMRMTQTCKSTGVKSKNRLLLADLGGCEQLKKSQPLDFGNQQQNEYARKQRAREAVNINLGLLALKQCVEALNRNAVFVPYTDSKLTMMLSTGLGGDSKTSIIVCGAQEQRHGSETIAAMKFGQICRGIYNTAKITNSDMIQELLEKLNNKIAECEATIRKYERWEMQKQVQRLDNGRIEEKQVTVVTGAEKYREILSQLVHQKMELTGDTVISLYNKAEAIEGFGNAYMYNMGKKVF